MRTGLTLLLTAVLAAGCAPETRSSHERTGGGISGAGAGGQGSISGGSSDGGDATNGGAGSMAGDSGANGATGGTSGGASGAAGASGGGAPGGGAPGGGTSGSGGQSSGGSAGTGGRLHVFLLLGASNMAGYPKAQAADKGEDPRIRVLGYDDCTETGRQTDMWDAAAPPLHECSNGAIGPGDYFARTLLPILPSSDTIGLVPCAISGATINTFARPLGSKYDWIVRRAQAALQAGGVIEGILFHLGESDTINSDWLGSVRRLVIDLRTELGIPNAPFLAGELAYQGASSSSNMLVNLLPGTISDSFVVSADGLAVDPVDMEAAHFGHDAQVELGRRYAAKMIEAHGW